MKKYAILGRVSKECAVYGVSLGYINISTSGYDAPYYGADALYILEKYEYEEIIDKLIRYRNKTYFDGKCITFPLLARLFTHEYKRKLGVLYNKDDIIEIDYLVIEIDYTDPFFIRSNLVAEVNISGCESTNAEKAFVRINVTTHEVSNDDD